MSDELLPITEADVYDHDDICSRYGVPIEVLAVVDGCVMFRGRPGTAPYAETMSAFVARFRKRAPKPPRYVVEWRVPEDGERYCSDYFDNGSPIKASVCVSERWVIVEVLS